MDPIDASIWIAVAFLFGLFIGRSRSKRSAEAIQNESEQLVRDTLEANFPSDNFHLLNHVTLPMGEGTTQIDHILVSKFGVFVIETKNYKGWIFASEEGKKWTQVLYRGLRFSFQNPLLQNKRHLKAVRDLLDFLPSHTVKPIVIFTGSAIFKAGRPRGVFRLEDFVTYLTHQFEDVMSINRLQFCVGRLEWARKALTEQTDVEHIESLRQRHESDN